jgi:hypothetical protein
MPTHGVKGKVQEESERLNPSKTWAQFILRYVFWLALYSGFWALHRDSGGIVRVPIEMNIRGLF